MFESTETDYTVVKASRQNGKQTAFVCLSFPFSIFNRNLNVPIDSLNSGVLCECLHSHLVDTEIKLKELCQLIPMDNIARSLEEIVFVCVF